MDNPYLLYKALHLLGIILFVGNIIITAWWKVMADRTGNPSVIAFAQRQVTLTDFVFTAGGALMVFLTGLANASMMGLKVQHYVVVDVASFPTLWLKNGFWYFTASGLIWVLVLIPVQIAQARMARQFAVSGVIPPRYWALGRIWLWAGILATLIPLANLYWMVFKPV